MTLKAPFPFFGGKSTIAGIVWEALGDCEHYMEAFFGSGAVLLSRPNFDPTRHTETVCDADGYVANVWRSLQFHPHEVARWCDWPVNHADLIARKARMIREEGYLLENLCKDDKWHDAELAGYWIWAASCWIGSGLTCPGQIPHLGHKGMGGHAVGQIPHLSDKGKGVHVVGQIPHLSDKGMGVHSPRNNNVYDWFARLSERLRYVRVVCGDWSRICGGDWQDRTWKTVGIFFDPPYGVTDRDSGVYHQDSQTVAADVREWAIERGERSNYRIVYAGYDTEGDALEKAGWHVKTWKTSGGYGNTARGDDSPGKNNRHRERLWFSPHCAKDR